MLKEIVENWKAELNGINLSKAILIEANLENARLNGTNLKGARLNKANLKNAEIIRAILLDTSLIDANLTAAKFAGQHFRPLDLINDDYRTKFQRTNLQGAILNGADMRYADLREAYGLTSDQLSMVKTLYGSALPFDLYKKLEKHYPHLFGPCFTNSSDPQKYIRPNMDFSWGQFHGYYFKDVNLEKVNLEYADLTASRNLDVDQICKAKSLYRAKLDPELEQQVKEKCPHLLEKPDWLKE